MTPKPAQLQKKNKAGNQIAKPEYVFKVAEYYMEVIFQSMFSRTFTSFSKRMLTAITPQRITLTTK